MHIHKFFVFELQYADRIKTYILYLLKMGRSKYLKIIMHTYRMEKEYQFKLIYTFFTTAERRHFSNFSLAKCLKPNFQNYCCPHITYYA